MWILDKEHLESDLFITKYDYLQFKITMILEGEDTNCWMDIEGGYYNAKKYIESDLK